MFACCPSDPTGFSEICFETMSKTSSGAPGLFAPGFLREVVQELPTAAAAGRHLVISMTLREGAGKRSFRIAGAAGGEVWDAQGSKYIDLTSGWNVVNAGWNNSEIGAAWRASLDKLTFRPSWCAEASFDALVAEFAGLVPGFVPIASCSGAEAIDNALKIARLVTGKTGVISLSDAYHGSSTGASLATGYDVPHLTGLGLEECRHSILYSPDEKALLETERTVRRAENAGALVFETVLTNAGCYVLTDEYLTLLKLSSLSG
jgi:4-aminobutyrate aminotransferase-like enzyme